MPGQFGGALRCSMGSQIGRRSTHPLALNHQLACAQTIALGAQHATADGEIETFGQDIHRPVAEAQQQFERRVLPGQFEQEGRHAVPPEQHGHGDMQPSGHLVPAGLHLCLGDLQFRQGPQAVVVVDLAIVGQALHARGAMEQPRLQPGFQTCHRLANGRTRQAEVLGGTRKAPQAHDLQEHRDPIEPLLALRNAFDQRHG